MRYWPVLTTLAFLLIAFLIFTYAVENADLTEKERANEKECINLGCPQGSMYISSVDSGQYFRCDCKYASEINSENRICFKSDKEAKNQGRVYDKCE
jgi:curli biogenesis system outer membrane secretion channel CsgG